MKKALITGITGQDGSYLAEFLLEKGYEVHGIVRRASISNTGRISHLLGRITIHDGDLSDSSSLISRMKSIISLRRAMSRSRLMFLSIPEMWMPLVFSAFWKLSVSWDLRRRPGSIRHLLLNCLERLKRSPRKRRLPSILILLMQWQNSTDSGLPRNIVKHTICLP